MNIRGINYDTGVNYQPGMLSRPVWDPASAKRDMQVIARELHCSAVTIFGTDINRIKVCAGYALEQGLEVWLQPRLVDGTSQQVLDHMTELAKAAETLRKQYGNVTFNLGCELSLFMKGILPGKNLNTRIVSLMIFWIVMPWFSKKLNRHLRKACNIAHSHFNGPLTYSSAVWEKVDWTLFDYVGVDYYKDKRNETSYTMGLRKLHSYGKPVVITEFGCCTFRGAGKKGGTGFLIINWKNNPPKVKEGYIRDEEEQAEHLKQLINIYDSENIEGAFVYAFSESSNPHTPNPEEDLDMASYGIVKVLRPPDLQTNRVELWEPKQAFYTLAGLYASGAASNTKDF